MKTDELISAIVADGASPSPRLRSRLLVALATGGLFAATLFGHVLGVRPDIFDALQTWRFDAKLAITVLCLVTALWATVKLARPDADQSKIAAALSLPVLALAAATGLELMSTSPPTWLPRAVGSNSRLCLTSITTLSIVPLLLLLLALRASAPRSPILTGAAAGLLAGALAATLYALHCPDDSPLFVALWYVPAVALVMLAGATIGYRLLRW